MKNVFPIELFDIMMSSWEHLFPLSIFWCFCMLHKLYSKLLMRISSTFLSPSLEFKWEHQEHFCNLRINFIWEAHIKKAFHDTNKTKKPNLINKNAHYKSYVMSRLSGLNFYSRAAINFEQDLLYQAWKHTKNVDLRINGKWYDALLLIWCIYFFRSPARMSVSFIRDT